MEHVPVLLAETIGLLSVKIGGRYIDGTFGRGGHAREIARLGGNVLGIDRDEAAIASAGEIKVVKGNHGDIRRIVNANGWEEVDGVLLDLGVSSPQLDDAGRGFSFLREGPLDMRMDWAGKVTAADLVNNESEERLAQIFAELGEEPHAWRVAKAIVRARSERGVKFVDTVQLASFVEDVLGRHGGHHPATRVFQALRMAVNDEIGELKNALDGGLELLKPGGRFAVITFESITDRIVKHFFAAHVGKMKSLQQGGEKWEGEHPKVSLITKKAVVAGDNEVNLNPRSRSAKLRVIERSAD